MLWVKQQVTEATSNVNYKNNFSKHQIQELEDSDDEFQHYSKTYSPEITQKQDQRLYNLLYRKSKLESINETSALLSGFAIVAIIELSLDSYIDSQAPDSLLVFYAIVSCLLVGIHLLALLMSMCILPELRSVIRQHEAGVDNQDDKQLSSLNIYIEIAWVVSTGFGLFLFILELCIIFWIKVSGFSRIAAISAVITLGIVACPFVLFAIGFYFRVARSKVSLHQTDFDTMERGAIARGLVTNGSTDTLSRETLRTK